MAGDMTANPEATMQSKAYEDRFMLFPWLVWLSVADLRRLNR
jgi:hypothetical protein